MKYLAFVSIVILTICIGLGTSDAQIRWGWGNSSDGALIVTGEVYTDDIRTTVVGSNPAGQNILQVFDASGFSVGDEVLIISMQDTEANLLLNVAGQHETKHITAISGNILTLDGVLLHTYDTDRGQKHQVIRVPNFTDVTVENGGTITAHEWDGATGGIVFFRATGTVTIRNGGKIDASGKGYRGGQAVDRGGSFGGYTGESILPSSQKFTNENNVGGGGAGLGSCGEASGAAGYGTPGGWPSGEPCSGDFSYHGQPGATYGDPALTRIFLGSGGGGGSRDDEGCEFTPGQNGGGIICIFAPTIWVDGKITTDGSHAIGGDNPECDDAIGGAGSGGSILLSATNFVVVSGTGIVSARGGDSTFIDQPQVYSGVGGDGRIRINYAMFSSAGTIVPEPFLVPHSADPNIYVSADYLDFFAPIGESDEQVLIVANLGDVDLEVTNITSDNGHFTASPTAFTLASQRSQEVIVTFTPTDAGDEDGTLTIESNDPDEPSKNIALHGVTPIDIPDPNLEKVIREKIGKPTGPITEDDLRGITELDGEGRGIEELTGLEYCINLQWLVLRSNQITDASPIAGLVNLKSLDLAWGNNRISDLTHLENLVNLEFLDLGGNQLDDNDIKSLSKLINLKTLWIEGNQISNVEPLASLTKLEQLGLGWNRIDNIQNLSGLINLTYLRLDSNKITDISPLSELSNLQWLTLNANQINNISALSGLINLEVLFLEWTKGISDITPLAGLIKLRELMLSDNQISDIASVANLTNLVTLFIYGNQISNIEALAGLTNLQNLWLQDNQIVDISHLSGLTNLRRLFLGQNQITDISSLSGLTLIGVWEGVDLDLNNNNISDIQPLVDNPGIDQGDTVDLRDNPLSHDSLYTYIPELQARGVIVMPTPVPVSDRSSDQEPRWGLMGNFYNAPGPIGSIEQAKTVIEQGEPIPFGPVGPINFSQSDDKGDAFGLGQEGETFVAVFYGYIYIPTAGEVDFAINADDGARLTIAGHIILEGGCTLTKCDYSMGTAHFEESGWYPIEIIMFENYGGHTITFRSSLTAVDGYSNPSEMPLVPAAFLSPTPFPRGDVSENGTISAFDASLILQYVVGIINEFPVKRFSAPKVTPHNYAVSMPDIRTHSDTRVRVPVQIEDATDLTAGGFRIAYDPTRLRPTAIVSSPLLSDYYIKYNLQLKGEVRVAFAGLPKANNGGILFYLEFDVLDKRDYNPIPLRFASVELANSLDVFTRDGMIEILPEKTVLLPNYPNPFNPETWIPYQLSEDAEVVVRIYDVTGRLINTLWLGHQSAGFYLSRSKAAYWNGKNAIGESVANGVYFYTLQAGNFIATRRMVIVK